MRALIVLLVALTAAAAADQPIRILFVGGDWKSQMTAFHGTTAMRGHFARAAVDAAAPGRFAFTLWTSYEFLQYGDAESLRRFDVVVVGDVMGQSVMPRLAEGVVAFVRGGGGFWYCDNHKAFTFPDRARSFAAVLPIETVEYRAMEPAKCQPVITESPLTVTPAAAEHPIMRGLAWASAPPLQAARTGTPVEGAVVLARSPLGRELWVARQVGAGRSLWTGGFFANDELSEGFCAWPDVGRFYAQALAWLAEGSPHAAAPAEPAVAIGTLTVDPTRPGPVITARHFGIHGQELAPNTSPAMEGDDLALYRALNLDGTFARTSAFMGVRGGGDHPVDDGVDLERFDGAKYDWGASARVLDDLARIRAEPVFLYCCPWHGPDWPSPERFTKYFAASLRAVNGDLAGGGRPRLTWFEIMNEPDLAPIPENLDRYAAFFNHAVETLAPRHPGVRFGCGGFNEWPYVQMIIDRCGANLHWLSRHPYGHTGEAVFWLHDRYRAYARAHGIDLPVIITEWDFWVYGEPAYDYLMQRWKPLIDHADSCLGSLHYRWREYQEGGYVFGLHGENDGRYGELPAEWPNPGRGKPITYRYDAWWIVRDLRGPQAACDLAVPALAGSPSTRAWAAATVNAGALTIVVHHGYPRDDGAKRYDALKLRVRCPLPADVRGRTLTVSRADARTRVEEPPLTVTGDALDLEIDVPARSSVALVVR